MKDIKKIIRKGNKNTRVLYTDGTTGLVPTSSLNIVSLPAEDGISFIKRLYTGYNSKFFNNLLPEVKISLNNRKSSLGYFRHPRAYRALPSDTELSFSKELFQLTAEAKADVILHEMIHVYQYFVLSNVDGHGANFKAKAREINRHGHHISTCFDVINYTQGENIYISKTHKGMRECFQFHAQKPDISGAEVYQVPKAKLSYCRTYESTTRIIKEFGTKL